MFSLVASNHRWADAPPELQTWITEQHGDGPWHILSVVPDGQSVPTITHGVNVTGMVERAIPGGRIVAWPPA